MLFLALSQVVALTGGTVHSMVPGEEPRPATVLVEDGVILAVGEALEIPEGAQVIELDGAHLVPGLIDGMVHHDLEHDPLYLLSGITLARDMGNDAAHIFLSARPAVRNAMPGPELLVCGPIFDGNPPATTEAVVVVSAEDVSDKLPRLFERGADFVSVHLGIPEVAWRRLIELAHEMELEVWGPVPQALTLNQALEGGQDGICYFEGFHAARGELEPAAVEAELAAFAESGAALMPLLSVYAYRGRDPGEDPPELNFLAPYYADWWMYDLRQRRERMDEAYVARGRSQLTLLQELLERLWRAGVPLVPGSGAPNPWLMPGAGLHDELALWVEAGIPPAEVLRLATAGAAAALGIEQERGTIQPERVADILVTDADPSANLSVLREPRGLLLRGTCLDREFLDELRDTVLKLQREAREKSALPLAIEKPELPEGTVVLAGRVESVAFERVVAAEEYWVVRCFDGSTAWCSKMVTPGGIGQRAREQTLIQYFQDEKFDRFELQVKSGEFDYRVESVLVASQFRLKRWLGGEYLDTSSSSGRPALVDAGLALPLMILAHYHGDGTLPVLYFEDFEPALAGWELQYGEDEIYRVKTPSGPLVAKVFENGGLDKQARTQGKSSSRYQSVRCDSFGGPGMVPWVERVGKTTVEPPDRGEESGEGEDGAGGD